MDGEYSSCIVCGSSNLRSVRGYESAYLVRCRRCSLAFSRRRATDDELLRHYEPYGTNWSDSEITRRRYRAVLDKLEPYRQVNRILDMGCGAGYFLEEAAKRGWDAYGTEFGELPRELSRERGFTVVPAPLKAGVFPVGHFDVVTSFEVVEHLRDPFEEAGTLAASVRVGGALYCTTPNFNALTRHVLGSEWRVVGYPEHLVYFTPRTLTAWLATFGFRQVELATTGISPATLWAALPRRRGSAAANDTASEPGALDTHLRQAAETHKLLQATKAAVNKALSLTGLGDTVKAVFVFDGPPARRVRSEDHNVRNRRYLRG